jgi:hypothetical protein
MVQESPSEEMDLWSEIWDRELEGEERRLE